MDYFLKEIFLNYVKRFSSDLLFTQLRRHSKFLWLGSEAKNHFLSLFSLFFPHTTQSVTIYAGQREENLMARNKRKKRELDFLMNHHANIRVRKCLWIITKRIRGRKIYHLCLIWVAFIHPQTNTHTHIHDLNELIIIFSVACMLASHKT